MIWTFNAATGSINFTVSTPCMNRGLKMCHVISTSERCSGEPPAEDDRCAVARPHVAIKMARTRKRMLNLVAIGLPRLAISKSQCGSPNDSTSPIQRDRRERRIDRDLLFRTSNPSARRGQISLVTARTSADGHPGTRTLPIRQITDGGRFRRDLAGLFSFHVRRTTPFRCSKRSTLSGCRVKR